MPTQYTMPDPSDAEQCMTDLKRQVGITTLLAFILLSIMVGLIIYLFGKTDDHKKRESLTVTGISFDPDGGLKITGTPNRIDANVEKWVGRDLEVTASSLGKISTRVRAAARDGTGVVLRTPVYAPREGDRGSIFT